MLTSIQNPLIKQIRKLQRSKERKKQNLALLEGTNLIAVACQIDYSLVTVCATRVWQQKHPSLWDNVRQLAQRTETVSPEVLEAIATTVNPDGIVATAERFQQVLSPESEMSLGLVLERLQDPGNLGTIIRTAVATQVEGLWLSPDTVDADHPKVLRASAGEWFRLPIGVSEDLVSLVKSYQARGLQVVATLPTANQTYWEVNWTIPSLILLGSEGSGLSPELISLADEQVTIPVVAGVESLNVAIAAAVLLYEVQRQRNFSQ